MIIFASAILPQVFNSQLTTHNFFLSLFLSVSSSFVGFAELGSSHYEVISSVRYNTRKESRKRLRVPLRMTLFCSIDFSLCPSCYGYQWTCYSTAGFSLTTHNPQLFLSLFLSVSPSLRLSFPFLTNPPLCSKLPRPDSQPNRSATLREGFNQEKKGV